MRVTNRLSNYVLVAAALFLCLPNYSKPANAETAMSEEKWDISAAFYRVFHNVDTYNWNALGDDFADYIVVDYRNLGASDEITYTKEELVRHWESRHEGYDTSQHMVANLRIDVNGDEATCYSVIRARHTLKNDMGDDYWGIEGRYVHKLIRTENGWKLSYAWIDPTFTFGNLNITSLQEQRFEERRNMKQAAE